MKPKHSPLVKTVIAILAAVGATILVGFGILTGYYTSR